LNGEVLNHPLPDWPSGIEIVAEGSGKDATMGILGEGNEPKGD
jgi:hypothetical protein